MGPDPEKQGETRRRSAGPCPQPAQEKASRGADVAAFRAPEQMRHVLCGSLGLKLFPGWDQHRGPVGPSVTAQ